MFRPVEFEITPYLGTNTYLEILIWPAPKNPGAYPDTRDEAQQCCKPAVSYGWDWHPRLIPLGIWEEAWIETRAESFLRGAAAVYTLSHDYSRAEVTLKAERTGDGPVEWRFLSPDGEEIFTGEGGRCYFHSRGTGALVVQRLRQARPLPLRGLFRG